MKCHISSTVMMTCSAATAIGEFARFVANPVQDGDVADAENRAIGRKLMLTMA